MILDRLKEKYKVNIGNEILIYVHDDFIIKIIDEKIVCINDLFYKKYRKLDEEIILNLINNNVFLQYYQKWFSVFKVYSKTRFKKKRYLDYRKVNIVFDCEGVIHRSSFEDLSLDEIIKLALEEPIRYHYEKIMYSPDKKRRIIIYKTSVGSFSYILENLCICDEEERVWSQCYAYYECVSAGGFFESVDLIVKELKYIVDWSCEDDL